MRVVTNADKAYVSGIGVVLERCVDEERGKSWGGWSELSALRFDSDPHPDRRFATLRFGIDAVDLGAVVSDIQQRVNTIVIASPVGIIANRFGKPCTSLHEFAECIAAYNAQRFDILTG